MAFLYRGQCPFCLFPVARDPGHLVRCIYEVATQVLYGPVTAVRERG